MGGREIAATLILTARSLAICSSPPFRTSVGLAIKSKAPRLSAFKAEYAPLEVWLLTTITSLHPRNPAAGAKEAETQRQVQSASLWLALGGKRP